MRNYSLSLFLVIPFILLFQWGTQVQLLTMVNSTFLLGLSSLLIGTCFYIGQTGFLDLFLEGFRKISNAVVPRSLSLERANQRLKEDVSLQSWKQNLFSYAKTVFLGLGSGMILFSIAGMYFVN